MIFSRNYATTKSDPPPPHSYDDGRMHSPVTIFMSFEFNGDIFVTPLNLADRATVKKQTRRSFLTACSLTTLGSMLPAKFYLQTSDKSGTRLPVVGSGVHTYECVHDWLVPPEGMVWGDTHGLCQDEQGNIYVGHTVHKSSMRGEAVVVFDEKGRGC